MPVAGPDLSAGQAAVEELMEDRCLIFPPSEPRDWVRNPETLRLETPSAVTPIYGTAAEPGRCKLKAGGAQSHSDVVAGVAQDASVYRLDLPLSAPPIENGAIFVLISSRRMPTAVGTTLTVGEPIVKTLAVQASYEAKRTQRTED